MLLVNIIEKSNVRLLFKSSFWNQGIGKLIFDIFLANLLFEQTYYVLTSLKLIESLLHLVSASYFFPNKYEFMDECGEINVD